MQKNQITFNYTAPYFKQGCVDDKTTSIWLIFHGYGQLAEDFQEKFSAINQSENVLIFPQGLSKFYLKGVDKHIGASWMTAHDRDTEIDNYICYLNQIYKAEIKPYSNQVKICILGFSQGAHTATRWIYRSRILYDKLILWGAALAHEINKDIVITSFNRGSQYVVIGDQDRFISSDDLANKQKWYDSIGFEYQLINYQGIHDIYPEILANLI